MNGQCDNYSDLAYMLSPGCAFLSVFTFRLLSHCSLWLESPYHESANCLIPEPQSEALYPGQTHFPSPTSSRALLLCHLCGYRV